MSLYEAIKDKPLRKGCYTAETHLGRLAVSKPGLEIVMLPQTEQVLLGLKKKLADWDKEVKPLFRRELDEEEAEEEHSAIDLLQCSEEYPDMPLKDISLKPYVLIQHTFLGGGSEGDAFKFYYAEKPIVYKFYNDAPMYDQIDDFQPGIEQFMALLRPPQKTAFITPIPYLATPYCCVMEDMSHHQGFFDFIRKHPAERNRLIRHLQKLEDKDPLVIDVGDIFYSATINPEVHGMENPESEEDEEIFEMIKEEEHQASVFIVQFNQEERNAYKRYKLATVDIALKKNKK